MAGDLAVSLVARVDACRFAPAADFALVPLAALLVAVFFVFARAGVLFLVVLRARVLADFAAILVADRALDFEACFAAGFLVAAFAP